jgi:hypothetical protein
MTLLTHFRNKKYAVVACDQKYSYEDKPPEFKSKIRILQNEEKIVGNYGRIIKAFEYYSEPNAYKFIEATIRQQQKDLQLNINYIHIGCGILIVDKERSVLLSKLFILGDEIPVEIELKNRMEINYSELNSLYKKLESKGDLQSAIRNTIELFCNAPIFFNELYSRKKDVDTKIHERFNDSFFASFQKNVSLDFNIELLNKVNIRAVIKSFYQDVYSWGIAIREKIGGNVDILILDIETGKIESEVINQPELEKETHCNGDNYFSFE